MGIGAGEILVVILVALIIWGPHRLPEIARNVGKVINTLKKTSSDITSAVTREINLADNEQRRTDSAARAGTGRPQQALPKPKDPDPEQPASARISAQDE